MPDTTDDAALRAYLSYPDAGTAIGWLTALGFRGRSVLAPHDTDCGTRRARVLDPGGRAWSFGSYAPGRAGPNP